MYRRRYRRITNFFARQLFSIALWDIVFPRIGLRGLSKRTRSERLINIASAYRELAIEMGGVLIKVGQFLSTRVDVLPPEVTAELAGLQDEVPPANFDEIVQVAEAEYGMTLDQKFLAFDEKPLAAASLGQVHRAKIFKPKNYSEPVQSLDNENLTDPGFTDEVITVVVKIQRPDIETIIATDMSALRTVGNWLDKYPPLRRRANITALLDEFSRILYEEIDYIAEGRNAVRFAENFQNTPRIRVPRVIWSYTTKRALTLENVWGIKITDYEALDAAGVDRAEVASRLIDTYLKQTFEDGFFHADPHPGNIFINPIPIMPPIDSVIGFSSQKSTVFWQLTFVDFGMVGHVSENTKNGLRELMIGVGTKNAYRVTKSYEMLNILLPEADLELLERAETDFFDRFWGLSMTELNQINPEEIKELAGEYRELLYALPFQIPQNLIFLFRTMGILSGICTGLDPNFNIFDHISPFAQKLIIEEARLDPKKIVSEVSQFASLLLSMPRRVDETINKLDRGQIAVQMPDVTKSVRHLEGAVRQIVWGIVFASLLLGGIQLQIADEETLALIMFGGALVSLIIMLLAGRRK
jgi:predicted unusual protein kinase regulating ubiquinone biosynthesis (AarF/ABC1/UbiB family)